MGSWSYVVDNLGQVGSQKDAKNQSTSFTYDVLGRMTRRLETDLDSKWYFESNALGTACTKGIGKLCEATTTNGYYRRNTYDSLGRLSAQTSHIDIDYVAQWSFDAAGRVSTQTFPASTGAAPFAAPLALKYNYTALGLLQSVANNATGAAYWTRTGENADGNLTGETHGNGLIAKRTYDALMGRLTKLQAGTGAAPSSVQNHAYHYDSLGRLDQRQDLVVGSNENFGYDNLNRLATANITAAGTGTQSNTVAYNAIGNITSKSGVGTYAYPAAGGARPHAVSGVSGTVNGIANPAYSYDANGNMQTDGARSFTWTSFNMPNALTKTAQAGSPGAGTGTFLYGPEHQRVKQTWVDAGKTLSSYYLSEPHFEKEVNSQSGITEYKHYVRVGSGIVAIHTRRSNATEDVKYLLADHLGSTSVVTDASGAVIDRQAFDPWGDRRTASGATVGAADPTNLIQPTSTTRGYTGHEQLDQGNMGLTHMNGRVYDPTLARFISADPYIQAPFSSQSFNRFSYVSNGPLNATDPSGYLAVQQLEGVGLSAARTGSWATLCNSDCSGLGQEWNASPTSRIAVLERVVKEVQSAGRGAVIAAGLGLKAAKAELRRLRSLPTLLGFTTVLMVGIGESIQPTEGEKSKDALTTGANSGQSAAAPPPNEPEGNDGDKQKKGRPDDNTKQNKQVKDAGNAEKLNESQRYELRDAVHNESRQLGRNLSYNEIRDLAKQVKSGGGY